MLVALLHYNGALRHNSAALHDSRGALLDNRAEAHGVRVVPPDNATLLGVGGNQPI